MKTYLQITSLLITFIILGCKQDKKAENTETVLDISANLEEELYRPNYHFTPKANWMNDPNGMFYYNGVYHLYFQYYPDGNVWGPMHWGHAKSKDLISWEEQPIAIYPDSIGLIFSGGAVVDKNNTSGFGKDGKTPIVAMYTYHNMDGEKAKRLDFQTQAIAYSLDEGQTFEKYTQNPVIKNPGIKDFRDPKVVWDTAREQWVMVLAAGQKIMFYSSKNLKDWKLISEFGDGVGAHGGVWECPDLFPMTIEGTNEQKWVLIVSINPGGPNGGSATQYFIGDFDGKTFKLDATFTKQLKEHNAVWLDYGRDNYAGVTWSNIPEADGRKLFIGWMSNWDYARDVPTETWRSTMTIARELKLKKLDDGYQLVSMPVSELDKYTSKTIRIDSLKVDQNKVIVSSNDVNLSKLRVKLELNNLKDKKYTFLFQNKQGDSLSFGIDNKEKYYFLDRTKSGLVNFSEKFAPKISKVLRDNIAKDITIEVLMDKTSIEVFFNEGETVITELFFPNKPFETLSIQTSDETLLVEKIKVEEFQFN